MANLASASTAEPAQRESLLQSFRDELFSGSWGKLEFELRRILQCGGIGIEARDARILEDLRSVEELRRRDTEVYRRSASQAVATGH